jgi:hypothetical protein
MVEAPLFPTHPELVVSTFAVDGTFGASTVVPSTPSDLGNVAAAPRGEGVAAIFVEGTTLRFAAFDASGAMTIAPKTVVTGVDAYATQVQVAAGPDGGFGVVFVMPTPGNGREIRFATLTADGDVRGSPRVLNGAGPTVPFLYGEVAIVADAGGYAMIWRDPLDARGGVDFARADAAGAEVVARRRVSVSRAPRKDVGASPTLLAVSGGYLAAWVESNLGAEQNGVVSRGASSEVRIVRLDQDGVASEAPSPLRAAEDDVDEVEPALVKVGDAVAVAWGRGAHIYICGGCVPDHRIDLMPIDPADLTPLGDVVTITNGAASPTVKAGGLLNKRLVGLGDTILAAYQLQFHTMSKPGSATYRCSAPPL